MACGRAAADLSKSSDREQHGVLDANHGYIWCIMNQDVDVEECEDLKE